MYILSNFLILSLISIINKTLNQIYNLLNVYCTDYQHKTVGVIIFPTRAMPRQGLARVMEG